MTSRNVEPDAGIKAPGNPYSGALDAAGRLRYISPSSLALWKSNREDWALKYLTRRDREPQTAAMGVGSYFDWKVKTAVMRLLGLDWDTDYEYTQSLEPQNRVEGCTAVTVGERVWQNYVSNGGWTSLLEMVRVSDSGICVCEKTIMGLLPSSGEGFWYQKSDPRYVGLDYIDRRVVMSGSRGQDAGNGDPRNAVLMGKPDLWFTVDGVLVILDWKVNGLLSRAKMSPKAGYVDSFPGRNVHRGTLPDVCGPLRWVCGDPSKFAWHEQLDTYAWCIMSRHGLKDQGGYYAIIDQTVSDMRVCRSRVWRPWNAGDLTRESYLGMWEAVNIRDHVFTDLDIEESRSRCRTIRGPGVESKLLNL